MRVRVRVAVEGVCGKTETTRRRRKREGEVRKGGKRLVRERGFGNHVRGMADTEQRDPHANDDNDRQRVGGK